MDDRSYRRALARLQALCSRRGLSPRELCEHLHLLQTVREYEKDQLPAHRHFGADKGDPVRTAVISDIHGNLGGLRAVTEDCRLQGCQRIVCLGDLVDGGPDDEAVVRWAMDDAVIAVRGNHDEFTDHLELSDASRAYLHQLPENWVEGDVLYTHISPRPAFKRSVLDPIEAWNAFDEMPYRLAFVGHTHRSFVFGARSTESVTATQHPFSFNAPLQLDPDDRYIISVGSAGYTREEPLVLRYGIYDQKAATIEIRAVEGPLLPLGIMKGQPHRQDRNAVE